MKSIPRQSPSLAKLQSSAGYVILIAWFAAISILPDPRPLSAPQWSVQKLQLLVGTSDAMARAVTTIALRGIGFGLLGIFFAIAVRKHPSKWAIPVSLLLAPVLAICSQWINHRYFPIYPQVQLSVIASLLGSMIGIALSRCLIALAVPAVICIGLFIWGTSTTISSDLATATEITGRHILARADEVPDGDEAFVTFTRLAFAYAEDNSHGTDPVFANRAAILSLAIILGEERIARMARGDVELSHIDDFVAIRKRTTLRSRHDLSRHFWVSAGLVVLTDANRSLTIGLGKELMDSTSGGSGFSFVDMMANRAGILFASSSTGSQHSAQEIHFRLRAELTSGDFLPDIAGLPEGIYRQEFTSQFGGLGGRKTREINQEIIRRLATASALHTPRK